MKLFLPISTLIVGFLCHARADADADAGATPESSADSDADTAHPHTPHHPIVAHPAPPYVAHPPPYGAPYHPGPHYTTGAPHYGHPLPTHGYPPAHPHPYDPPKCAHGNPKTYCIVDPEYPEYEIKSAIQYHYDAVQQLYKDVLANTENSVDLLKDIVEETYLCPSESDYIQPRRAVNTDGKWRIVVNGVKANYETLTQTARVEECLTPGSACPLIPECYETKCLQKSIYHRFLVYDPYDTYLPFSIESFKLPASCACQAKVSACPAH